MSFDKAVLKKSEEAILGILGNILDLSPEMANTVCNIYYKYFKLLPEESVEDIKDQLKFLDDLLLEDADNPFVIVRQNIDTLEDVKKKGSYESIITAEFICLNKLIPCLRIFRDHKIFQNDRTYFFLQRDLILDIFKYKINRALDKTPIRRKFERKISKIKINEIPNLVDFMEVRIDDEEEDDEEFIEEFFDNDDY